MSDHRATRAPLEQRLRVDGLAACERSPVGYGEILAGIASGGDDVILHARLDEALAGPSTVEGILASGRLARRMLAAHIDVATDAELDTLERRVAERTVDASALKRTLYALARRYDVPRLTESSWFEGLFDRVESGPVRERHETEET